MFTFLLTKSFGTSSDIFCVMSSGIFPVISSTIPATIVGYPCELPVATVIWSSAFCLANLTIAYMGGKLVFFVPLLALVPFFLLRASASGGLTPMIL